MKKRIKLNFKSWFVNKIFLKTFFGCIVYLKLKMIWYVIISNKCDFSNYDNNGKLVLGICFNKPLLKNWYSEFKDIKKIDSYTTDAIDFSEKLFVRHNLIWIWQWIRFWKVKIYYDKKQKCWARKIATTGTIKDDYFYPDPGQLITYKIRKTSYVKKI